jgi:hypothetical protein
MPFGMEPKIRRETLSRHGRNFTAYLIELENAIIGFFFEEEACRLGTLALALPRSLQPPSLGSSSVLIGHKNVNIARILAEYLSSKYGKISLASVFLRKEADLEGEKNLLELAKILK